MKRRQIQSAEPFFKLILKWAVESGCMLVHIYSLLQWSCMAISKEIGELAYHNFTTGDNFIKIRYNKTRADQDSENIRDKHVYAEPFNTLVCPVLAYVWLTLESKILGSTTSLFAVENVGANASKISILSHSRSSSRKILIQ